MIKYLYLILLLIISFVSCNNTSDRPVFSSANIGTMIYVPAGSFTRDAEFGSISVITDSFFILATEITGRQFISVTGMRLTGNHTNEKPVKFLNWYHAIIFCNKLSIIEGLSPVYSIGENTNPDLWLAAIGGTIPTGRHELTLDSVIADWTADGYRLPTEMEWEWAAMGARSGGRGYRKAFAGSNDRNSVLDYAWFLENSESSSHEVAKNFQTKSEYTI